VVNGHSFVLIRQTEALIRLLLAEVFTAPVLLVFDAAVTSIGHLLLPISVNISHDATNSLYPEVVDFERFQTDAAEKSYLIYIY